MNENNNVQHQDKADAFLPPVELIQRYEELGIGEDLMSVVKDEQEHRHGIQKRYIFCYILGQITSFALTVLVFFGIYKLILSGLKTEAYTLLGVYVMLFVFAFVKARKDRIRNINNNSKRKVMTSSNKSRQQRKYNNYSNSYNK